MRPEDLNAVSDTKDPRHPSMRLFLEAIESMSLVMLADFCLFSYDVGCIVPDAPFAVFKFRND